MDRTKVFVAALVAVISVSAVCLFSSGIKIKSGYSKVNNTSFEQWDGVKKTLPVDPENDKVAVNLPVHKFGV